VVLVLSKGSASERNDHGCSPAHLFQETLKSSVLSQSEFGFAGISEDVLYGAPFAALDAIIEVLKKPIQLLSECAAYTRLARSHEANKKHSIF